MSLRRQSIRGSFVLTLGEGVGYGASFVRNMILARMLTKADFGIAAAFSMIITLLEFSAKLGISRFVIRDKEGDDPAFLATAHLVQAVAALLSSLLMVAAAWPLARLFGIGDHVGALYVLALIPLFNGLGHLDVRRFERKLRFGPSTLTEVIPQVTIMLAAWPAAHWLGDYRAVLVLLIVKGVCSCVGSHWLAEQPYRWRMHREYVTRMLRFGWPLLVTGFLLFGVMQGDQFLVASFYSMADLAPYAAAAALTLAPSFIFGRIFNSIALPVMAQVQDDPAAFARRYRVIIAGISIFSAAYSVGMIIGAEVFMRWVYGAKYAGAGILLGWLSAANSFRNLRIAPTLAAMARGDSVNAMASNMARAVALLPALAVAVTGRPIWMIASVGLLGEALACLVSFRRLSREHGVPFTTSLWPTVLVTIVVGLAGGATLWGVPYWHPVLALALAAGGAGFAALAVGGLLEASRREARHWGREFRRQGWRHWRPGPKGGGVAARPVLKG